MGEGVPCSEALTPPRSRSLGYLQVECALNYPAGCYHHNPPPPPSCLPEGESARGEQAPSAHLCTHSHLLCLPASC